MASKFPHFFEISQDLYEVACTVMHLRILSGGEWCAVPHILLAGFDAAVSAVASFRTDEIRRLCDLVILSQEGNRDAVAKAPVLANSLVCSSGKEITTAIRVWNNRVQASAARMVQRVAKTEDSGRAVQLNAQIVQLCTNLEKKANESEKKLVGWDICIIVLAQQYGYRSTRVLSRLVKMHP